MSDAQAAASSLPTGVRLQSSVLAKLLACKRHFIRVDESADDGELGGMCAWLTRHAAGPKLVYDPRFLVFEFTYNLLLRKSQVPRTASTQNCLTSRPSFGQVELVQQFMQAVHSETLPALCHQMIMGAGKTTVVGPLLALMLADGGSLVMQVRWLDLVVVV